MYALQIVTPRVQFNVQKLLFSNNKYRYFVE
jgi:hypothetical protein